MCFRFGTGKRRAWTLLSLAVRIAHALGLHRETEDTVFTPFETEMRRRLWWQLCVHDIWQSEDRGLDPMIHEFSFSTLRPANVNDDDLDPNDLQPVLSRTEGTIMTFSLIGYEVYSLLCKLHYAPPSRGQYDYAPSSWEQKEALAKEFCDRLDENIIKKCDLTNSFNWMSSILARVIQIKVFLVLHFPMQSISKETPPPVNKEVVLSNSVTFLELLEELETSKNTALWWWHLSTWIQWHALAVTLAELCTQTQGLLADRGWAIVDTILDKYSKRISDTKGSRLWRPIKKLYNKAKIARSSAPTVMNFAPILRIPETQSNQITQPSLVDFNIGRDVGFGEVAKQSVEAQNTVQNPGPNPPFFQPMSQMNQWITPPEGLTGRRQQIDLVDWEVWEQFLQDTSEFDSSNLEINEGGPASFSIW